MRISNRKGMAGPLANWIKLVLVPEYDAVTIRDNVDKLLLKFAQDQFEIQRWDQNLMTFMASIFGTNYNFEQSP